MHFRIVLSFENKNYKYQVFSTKKLSFKNILNINGPKIVPCSTPYLVHCLRLV